MRSRVAARSAFCQDLSITIVCGTTCGVASEVWWAEPRRPVITTMSDARHV
jgi:hypothetical protein